MYVNQTDLELERDILFSVQPVFPRLEQYDFQQSQSKTAIFDFRGYLGLKVVAGLDVKVRDTNAYKYPNYFISKDKVAVVKAHPEFDFFILYYFEYGKTARLYYLNDLELPETTLNFRHKRGGNYLESKVHQVPANAFIGECMLM